MTESNVQVIQVHPDDNVAVAVAADGIKAGTAISQAVTAKENIPMGHKIALTALKKGDAVIRYNEVIGYTNVDIPVGGWINEMRVEMPTPPQLSEIGYSQPEPRTTQEPLEEYTFMGYRNADGSVGTRNIFAISTSVQCVKGLAEHVRDKIKQELLPQFPNVDDVVALNHTYGCGVAINAPAAVVPIRTLQNLTKNPNFGGEVMVLGLGCEKLVPERLMPEQSHPDNLISTMSMQDPELLGFAGIVKAAMEQARAHLEKLNQRTREVCPVSDLVIGVQCGGSDAFSGLTANPAVGYAADMIVQRGGSVMFSEVTEVRDAIHLLVPRAADQETADALIREMQWYDDYLDGGKADRSANTSPGNKKGGLSNIVEKALGSVIKSGNSLITDVLSPGEKIRKKGLTFAATPASDFICGTLQLASGMALQVFTTGRGTPYGLAAAPVIKVSTNTPLAQRWFDLIDLDAGTVATGHSTIEEKGTELFRLILAAASGEYTVAADRLGLHNDLTLFNPAPVT